MTKPLWSPPEAEATQSRMAEFMDWAARAHGLQLTDYDQLYRWSVTEIEQFWTAVWEFCGVIGEPGERVLVDGERMPGARFFPDARLNFAENLLRRRDASDAMVFWSEDRVRSRLSWAELHDTVSSVAQALRAEGVGPGDRVAALMPNCPETVIAMLAATSLGATWCSCAPEFGEQGVLDRFGQIEPKVLFACDGYFYSGKEIDCLDKVAAVARQLPTVTRVIVTSYLRGGLGRPATTGDIANAMVFDDIRAAYEPTDIEFARLPFDHPLYILFSSGTTGVPKCIVHSAGGTLLQHLKEHQLHADIRPGDRLFYFTTCTWMMWNWLVSGLAAEATLLLYDGSPFYPQATQLLDYADVEAMTHFGASAKYIEHLSKQDVRPNQTHRLDALRMIFSTGSPLAPQSFDYVYEHVKESVYLASISGGTDIVSCFVLGCPLKPLYRGEIACRGLGMAVEVWDSHAKSVTGEKGELVCTRPFVSMPVGFWGDRDGKKYHAAYFDTYPNTWVQGDFAELTERGGMIIYGRSDAILNPGGVRIGTAEIYRQVEKIDEVVNAVVIGQSWDNDVRVVLFVVMKNGAELSDELIDRIRLQIRTGASPRHVPAKVIPVADIPMTRSGKIAELAVRDVVEGRAVKNQGALANPESLALFAELEVLQV